MSKGSRIYLDHNATTPLLPQARDAMVDALEHVGNASSVHGEGRAARGRIESARRALATATGALARNVIFTSGGTEANVTALSPLFTIGGVEHRATRAFISAVEHACVMAGGRFAPEDITLLPVDGNGVVDLEALRALVAAEVGAGGLPFVSVMAANNETGVLQPIAEIGAILRDVTGGREAGFVFHVDAVQALGRIPVDIAAWGCDMLTVSSHKIGGPQGVGALVYAREAFRVPPLVTGGGQEMRKRAGTENTAGIAGFGAALQVLVENGEKYRDLAELRDWLEESLTHISGNTVIFGRDAARLANTISFAVPGMVAETALIACDLAGAALSSGSACSSGKVTSSHVLDAMGVSPDLARGALRVSLGWTTTREDVERFADLWQGIVRRMKPASSGQAA